MGNFAKTEYSNNEDLWRTHNVHTRTCALHSCNHLEPTIFIHVFCLVFYYKHFSYYEK